MFNVGKSSNLKKILVFMVCLFAGISMSSVFAINNSAKQVIPTLSTLSLDESEDVKVDDGLELAWSNKPSVIQTAYTDNTVNGLGYTIQYDNAVKTLNGGTFISLTSNTAQQKYTIKFGTSKDSNNIGEAVITASTGYYINAINFGVTVSISLEKPNIIRIRNYINRKFNFS